MPLPLSFAFACMKFAQKFHSSPTYKRPFMLRKVLYSRCALYVIAASVSISSFYKKKGLIDNINQSSDLYSESLLSSLV